MNNPNTGSLPYKRKLRGRTDYRKRIRLLSSGSHRLVVRLGLRSINVSLISYSSKGDRVDVSANSSMLDKFGWKGNKGNIPSAYLTGYLAGLKAKEKKIEYAILDIGTRGSVNGSRVYAAIAGAIDSGMEIPQGENSLPSKERISGAHIAQYAQKIKNNKERYNRQFSCYLKMDFSPEEITKHFEEIKSRITSS